MSDGMTDTTETPAVVPAVEGDEEAVAPEVTEDDDKAVAPEAGTMPAEGAEDGDKSDAI